jgi:hypothetical protein
MSNEPDPLEIELRSLRPAPLSPGFRRRISDRLRRQENSRVARSGRWLLVPAAAALGIGIFLAGYKELTRTPHHHPGAISKMSLPMLAGSVPTDVQPFTLAAYVDASTASADALYAMLDKQSITQTNTVMRENGLGIATHEENLK